MDNIGIGDEKHGVVPFDTGEQTHFLYVVLKVDDAVTPGQGQLVEFT